MEEKDTQHRGRSASSASSSIASRHRSNFEQEVYEKDDLRIHHDHTHARSATNVSTRSHRSTLSRAVSMLSDPTTHIRDPSPPPNGGRKAWMQAVMGHLVITSTWGYISSFGVFQTYYESTLSVSGSAISWVGSVQIFLLFAVSTFTGRSFLSHCVGTIDRTVPRLFTCAVVIGILLSRT